MNTTIKPVELYDLDYCLWLENIIQLFKVQLFENIVLSR